MRCTSRRNGLRRLATNLADWTREPRRTKAKLPKSLRVAVRTDVEETDE